MRCTKYNPFCLPIEVHAQLLNYKKHLEEPFESRGSRTVL